MIAVLMVELLLASGAEVEGRESLQQLVEHIPRVADTNRAINKEEEQLAARIQAHGAAAIPLVIPLLDSDSEATRAFAGYVLRDLDGLAEAHLDSLIQARRSGDGWIPPAIARIGSPRAIAFLVEDLRENPEVHTQVTGALVSSGRTAAVLLARQFQMHPPVGRKFADAVCQVLGEMGALAEAAVTPLLEAVTSSESHPDNSRWAIQALGCVGPSAAAAAPVLKSLLQNPAYRASAESTLMKVGTPAAIPVFEERLRTAPSMDTLRTLAGLREQGRAAGRVVQSLLSRRHLRFAATRTLGYIQYDGAIDVLIAQLKAVDDWTVVFASAEALGRLGAARAIGPLEDVAAKHWAPPVRGAARTAIKVIEGEGVYPEETDEFTSGFSADALLAFEPTAPLNPVLMMDADELDASALKRWVYDAEIRGYDADGEHIYPIQQEPACGLRVANGVLLGGDGGEWGGELMHMMDGASPKKLLDRNTRGIHKLGTQIVAVTGMAHLVINEGMVYRVFPDDPSFVAKPWRRLPGAPLRSGRLADGRLFISCIGGDVILSEDGDIQLATPENLSSNPP